MNGLVSSQLAMVHIWVSSQLTVVSRLMTLHLIVMTTLVMLDSAHSAQSLVMRWLDWNHFLLHFLLLLSLQSFLFSLHVFFLLLITFVEHITNLSQMVNFGVSSIKLVIFISTLNYLILETPKLTIWERLVICSTKVMRRRKKT
jgi:hypothetical protein